MVSDAQISEEYSWFASNENQEVKIVKPIERIMGNWLLVENRDGVQWYVPFPELKANKTDTIYDF